MAKKKISKSAAEVARDYFKDKYVRKLKEYKKLERALLFETDENKRIRLRQEMDSVYKNYIHTIPICLTRYLPCDHQWVTIGEDYDMDEGTAIGHYACIKCGLEQMPTRNGTISLEQIAMRYYNSILGSYARRGVYTGIVCDKKMGMAIFERIKRDHPDMDDATVLHCLEVARYSILEKGHSKGETRERIEADRRERLGLPKGFYKWDEETIVVEPDLYYEKYRR